MNKCHKAFIPLPVFRCIDDIGQEQIINIYGAGGGGQAFRDYAGFCGRKIHCFIDSYQTGLIDRIPIVSPQAFAASRQPIDTVVIASSYVAEITAILHMNGVYEGIFDASIFVGSMMAEKIRLRRFFTDGCIILQRKG